MEVYGKILTPSLCVHFIHSMQEMDRYLQHMLCINAIILVSMATCVNDNVCPIFMYGKMTCGRGGGCLQVLLDLENAPEKIISYATTALSLRQTLLLACHKQVLGSKSCVNLANKFSSKNETKITNSNNCKQHIRKAGIEL